MMTDTRDALSAFFGCFELDAASYVARTFGGSCELLASCINKASGQPFWLVKSQGRFLDLLGYAPKYYVVVTADFLTDEDDEPTSMILRQSRNFSCAKQFYLDRVAEAQ